MSRLTKISFLCAMGLAVGIMAHAFGKNDAQAVVNKFYKCLKIIAEEKYTEENTNTVNAENAKNEAISLCYDLDINMPNEFHDFGFEGNDAFIFASAYMTRLRNFALAKGNVRYITADVREVRALEEIKHRTTESNVNFYVVYVEKTISAGNMQHSYIDSVTVNVENGVLITNVTNDTNGGIEESIIQLRAKAAEMFSNGKYQEAYDAYSKIVKKDPMQGDSFYRLALMCFQKKGVEGRFKNRSARMKQAFKFLGEAKKFGSPEVKRNAQNVEYDMTNGFV